MLLSNQINRRINTRKHYLKVPFHAKCQVHESGHVKHSLIGQYSFHYFIGGVIRVKNT